MIDLGYKKTETVSTDDLPGVLLSPAIEFEFNMETSVMWNGLFYDCVKVFMSDVKVEIEAEDDELLLTLLPDLLVSITNASGDKFKLPNRQEIDDLVDSTSIVFVRNVSVGFWLWHAAQREEEKKTQPTSSQVSPTSGNKKPKAKQ